MVPRIACVVAGIGALVLAPPAHAQRPEIHCKHFFFGYPFGAPATNDLIVRDVYALSSNDATKFADWVAYRIDPHSVWDRADTSREWRADPWLEPGETLEPDDYTGASDALGTDRGHQAPLASFKGDFDWRHSNYLSNITPQQADLNQGPWKDLEDEERELVRTWREVWVMTGPLFEQAQPQLPNSDETHSVPSAYWKIVAIGEIDDTGSVQATGFVMPQDAARDADFTNFVVSIDEIEQRSGLDFFWLLPNHVETQLESQVGSWPLTGGGS